MSGREALLKLNDEREALEERIAQIREELETCSFPSSGADVAEGAAALQPVGLTGGLVDAEGFPRADVDVYAVRHRRHELARLQTDHQVRRRQRAPQGGAPPGRPRPGPTGSPYAPR